jgi:hypothetical protein
VVERDDFTLCYGMIVELWMRKREIGDENEIDVKNTSRYPKSGIQLA